MSAKDVFGFIGLWLSKLLFVAFLVAFVAAITATNLTSESFIKPIMGKILASQTSNIGNDQSQAQMDSLFSEFYNKKVCSGYGCIDMLKNLKNPLDIVTADFNRFLKSSLWILGALVGLFGLFIILLARGLPGKFLSLGSALIAAGLPYFAVRFLENNIGSMISLDASMAASFTKLLIDPVANIFLLILILGVVCCAVGFGIKIYRKIKEKKGKKGKK